MPRVDVIIPARNRLPFLLEAIDSVLGQTYLDYRLIVVDDGSEVSLTEARERVEQNGQIFMRQAQRGVSAARNAGIKVGDSPWIAFLDSDDLWLPKKLARQVEFINSHPHLLWSHCRELWLRNGVVHNQAHRHEPASGEAFKRCLELCCISPSTVMISRKLFELHGLFDEEMPVCEDYDLWLRLSFKSPIGLLNDVLVVKRGGHAQQLSRSLPALDRFRIYSMVKMLKSPELPAALVSSVVLEVQRRAGIVAAGAAKRGNHNLSTLYGELAEISTAEMLCRKIEQVKSSLDRSWVDRCPENYLEP